MYCRHSKDCQERGYAPSGGGMKFLLRKSVYIIFCLFWNAPNNTTTVISLYVRVRRATNTLPAFVLNRLTEHCSTLRVHTQLCNVMVSQCRVSGRQANDNNGQVTRAYTKVIALIYALLIINILQLDDSVIHSGVFDTQIKRNRIYDV